MSSKSFPTGPGKLVEPVTKSHVAGLQAVSSGSVLGKAVGECPVVSVCLGGQNVHCLLDTGAQVSTITETFFREHFAGERDLEDVSTFIRITGSHGLDIPYLGYVELPLTVEGEEFGGMGFLVVRDPVDQTMRKRKLLVPGVLGSNVLRDLRKSTEGRASQAIKADSVLGSVLALYGEVRASSTEATLTGRVRIASRSPILVPAQSLRVVEATVRPARKGEVYTAVIEQYACFTGPSGFALAPSVVQVMDTGRVPIQVANFSNEDFYLSPRATVGALVEASLDPETCVSELQDGTVFIEETAVKQPLDCPVIKLIERLDIGDGLTEEQHGQLRTVLEKYCNTFSQHEDDLGLCTMVEHKIPTIDDIPVKVPHRRVPPQQWLEVRDYLEQSVRRGIIQNSSSPYASPVVIVRKKDGSLRLCVNYRALNSKTVKDAYPLPRIEEALDAIGGAKFFCSLDLAMGYHQLPVASEDIPKTAFRVGTGGLYEYYKNALWSLWSSCYFYETNGCNVW